jgi:hypothetical protein
MAKTSPLKHVGGPKSVLQQQPTMKLDLGLSFKLPPDSNAA